MTQYSLPYRASHTGREAWLLQLEVLRAAVTYLTPKEVLDEIDVAKLTLSEAVNEQRDKRWAAEWTPVIKVMLFRRGDELSRDLLRRLVDAELACTPFAICDSDEVTPEEELVWQRVEAKKRRKTRAR